MKNSSTRMKKPAFIAALAVAAAVAAAVPAAADDHTTLAGVHLQTPSAGHASPHDDHTTGSTDDHSTLGADDHTTGGADDHTTSGDLG